MNRANKKESVTDEAAQHLVLKDLLNRFDAAKKQRGNWENLWQECYDYALPQRGGFLNEPVPGGRRTDKIYDATALDAVDQLAASMLGNLTPTWSQWFGLKPGPDLSDADAQRLAPVLEKAGKTIQDHFDRSNFSVEIHQCYLDLIVGGTASLSFEEAPPGEFSAFRFAAVPLSHAIFEESESGYLDGVYRVMALTAAQIAADGVPAKASEPAASTEAPVAAGTASSPSSYASGHASPAASKILAEKGIAPAAVAGSGKDGRITKEDALGAQKTAPTPQPAATPAPSKAAEAAAAPVVPGSRNVRREKMSSLRKTVSRRLVAVKNETAMLTTFNEVNMKPIMDLRSKFKDQFKEKHGVGLGFMSFFTKAVCVALKEWPAVNAQIDGTEIVYNDFCDISVAVSAPKGLVVPVIRNAEAMSFDQIEKEIVRLAGKARDNKLSIEEMTGGTFTLTNGGVFGSMMSTPIINAPQSAILGMHNIVERPMAVNGEVKILPMMYLALSYDHRIIDGRESVSFLVRVKQLLEDPTRLLFGV